jgi:hypothetical protein
MNVLPIRREALATPSPADAPTREDVVRQTANLARTLADVLMANVQNTTSLNLAAARALLTHARIPVRVGAEQHQESWRTTWRSFEICATSAEQVLGLTRGHAERTTAALWRSAERMLEELALAQAQRVSELLAGFEALRAAQDAYWQAAQRAHRELVALAQAPCSTTAPETRHDTH